ncbi:MAG: tetraacyldisaccharide 4'-kinase [Deltaproteobacteria bacterium]|nr:tetraacyldisaccharide 4'-kinase [Candidatus Anaeroferrophillus wilburensis]MBN2889044.1 tetraacyldisaccharide 4'-kinase [Deltaproteobacteria bacterium]
MINTAKRLGCYLLYPPSLVYQALTTGRNLLYDFHLLETSGVPVPVICVGNLTVGGTGKTPMVAWLANHFISHGKKVALLSRGYQRRNNNNPLMLLPDEPADRDFLIDDLGDEAALLHSRFPDAALILDTNRRRGATAVCSRWQPDIIIMDDGFQHRRLQRDINLVMIDSQRLFGNGHLLPAGPLRESLAALERADLVVLNKFDLPHPDFGGQIGKLFNHISPRRVCTAMYRLSSFHFLSRENPPMAAHQMAGQTAVAFAGIGNPDYFFQQLEGLGITLKKTLTFPDHCPYTAAALEKISRAAAGCDLAITTAKDAVKIAAIPAAGELLPQLTIADIELQINQPERFNKLLESRLALRYSAKKTHQQISLADNDKNDS